MIKYIVAKSEDGKTLERILLSHFPIERNGFYKALRKKDIKINRLEKNLRIGRTTKNGYVRQVYADSLMIKGEDFADWFHLASNNFYFEQYKGKLRIICLGKGNGLGMSQYGAGTMAKTGKSYKKILKYYYPKTMIQKLYE